MPETIPDFTDAKLRTLRGRCGSESFYRSHLHYGTGNDALDNLAERVVTLLQVQADHARTRT